MVSRVLIYKPLYIVLHSSFTFFEFLFTVFLLLNQKINEILEKFTIVNEREYIFNSIKPLEKTPTHVTVLLGNEKPSYRDLANLVIWSLAAGISFISFYDYKGVLHNEEHKLQEAINRQRDDDYHIIWHNGVNPCKNGFIGRKIHVRTLSLSDAQDSVVKLTKQVCSAKKDEVINQETIDNYLRNTYVFPDPDLGIYFGRTFSLYGYPPWQIRVTEFLGLETHHNVSVTNFTKLLYRYNKIEQRFGK